MFLSRLPGGRLILAAVASILGAAAVPAPAVANPGDRLIVIEHFTSQGCDRCPPVDDMLRDLARWPDVLPLALHVDYWDYMGWRDRFALPENTERQMQYAPMTSRKRLFTPLLVVGGLDMAEGFQPMKVVDLIEKHRAVDPGVHLRVEREGDRLVIRAEAAEAFPAAADIVLVLFRPESTVEITHGENAGRVQTYTNVVTHWQEVTHWDGNAPLLVTLSAPDGDGAVFVQREGPGLLLPAQRF
jgi:hypothetical protein